MNDHQQVERVQQTMNLAMDAVNSLTDAYLTGMKNAAEQTKDVLQAAAVRSKLESQMAIVNHLVEHQQALVDQLADATHPAKRKALMYQINAVDQQLRTATDKMTQEGDLIPEQPELVREPLQIEGNRTKGRKRTAGKRDAHGRTHAAEDGTFLPQ